MDVALITAIWPCVERATAGWGLYLPPSFLARLFEQCTCLTKNMYVENKGKKLIKYVVKGTTFSGYCLNTTLGNTLRSILYTKVQARLSGTNVALVAAGDDQVIWVQKQDCERFV